MDAGCRQRSCRTGFHGATGYARSAVNADITMALSAIAISPASGLQFAHIQRAIHAGIVSLRHVREVGA